MRNVYLAIAVLFYGCSFGQNVVTGEGFKNMLLSANATNGYVRDLDGNAISIDANNDGQISAVEALEVGSIEFYPTSYNEVGGLLGIEYFTNLERLILPNNFMGSINLTALTHLEELDLHGCITYTINFTNLPNLREVNISNTGVPTLSLTGLTSLEKLNCSQTTIQSLSFPNTTTLKYLDCSLTNLTTLNVTGQTNLEELNCSGMYSLYTLNIQGLTQIKKLDCSSDNIHTLDITQLTQLQYLDCSGNSIQVLQPQGCTQLTNLDCHENQISTLLLPSSVVTLECYSNSITALDVSALTQLQLLKCHDNQLTSLDVSQNSQLKLLWCSENQIASLDLSAQASSLEDLNFGNTGMAPVDITGLAQLKHLVLDGVPQLQLPLPPAAQLNDVWLVGCGFTYLDFSQHPELHDVIIQTCPNLEYVNVKNGTYMVFTDYGGTPQLKYVCANESDIAQIQSSTYLSSSLATQINSLCSFTPNGTFNTLAGKARFDVGSNGCQLTDPPGPFLQYNVYANNIYWKAYSDTQGEYSAFTQVDQLTVTPVLENPSAFEVTPPSVTKSAADFVNGVATQDFCIKAVGNKPDAEITIVPLDRARPGFDTRYVIYCHNKGNKLLSGTVTLTFDAQHTSLLSTQPSTTATSEGQLQWNYAGLMPFNTKSFFFILHVNAPTDPVPVDLNTVLSFEATVTTAALTDILPQDNVAQLDQQVVGSFDPNDKTCIEGTVIDPSMAGKYVHYVIHFENTGTAPATNITVQDRIDYRLDASSLIPLGGSHPFETRISNQHDVGFFFHDINLPFEQGLNDGFVCFKVKVEPWLVSGNQFQNKASIFFDYNLPIVTPTATTTLAMMGVEDFDFDAYFSLYPNPVSTSFSLTSKTGMDISSVVLYDLQGRQVSVFADARVSDTFDISGLPAGTYFVKVFTANGVAINKLLKR